MTLGIGAATEPPAKPFRVSFVLAGEPVPKERPRFAQRGSSIISYTPTKTKAYETAIAYAAKFAMTGRKTPTGPLVVTVEAVLGVPKSWTAKQRQGALDGTTRPDRARKDLDNIIKAVLDGGNHVLWKDDRQVCELHATKAYGAAPYLRVEVKECQP